MARVVGAVSPPQRLLRVEGFQLGGGLLYAAIFVYFSLRAKFTTPYVDDWSLIASLQDRPWAGLWTPHNEHIIVIPRLLLWLDLWIWGWPGYATWAAGLLSHFVMAGVLIRTCRDRSAAERRWLAGLVLIAMCLTYELQGLVFPGAINFPLVSGFACLSIACLCHAAEPAASRGRLIALSAALSVMAMLCVTNGVLVPVVLVGLSLLLRLPRWATVVMMTLTIGAALSRYLLGGVPGTIMAAEPLPIARFALAMLAGPLASVSSVLAIAVGALYVVGGLAAAVKELSRKRPSGPTAVLLGNVWFVLLSACMAALGRAQFDVSVGAESRYTELVALGWASLLLLGVPAGTLATSAGRRLAAATSIVTFALLPLQLFVGAVWAIKADHLDVASLVLTVGVPNDDWLWRIHPGGTHYITDAMPQLRARDVAFLRFRERGQVAPVAPACHGVLTSTSEPAPDRGLEVYGALRDEGARIQVVDRSARVVGLGKSAPAVLIGRATPNSMVWALIDRIRGESEKGQWLGFAQFGTGGPYTVRLLDHRGQVVCQAPVACCAAVPHQREREELVVRGGLVEGFLDSASCSMIHGWAWDSLRPGKPVEVDVRISDGTRRTVLAAMGRTDLASHTHGYADHGFVLRPPQLSLPAGTWQVDVRVAGSGVPLSGSPKTITCPDQPAP